MRKIVDLIPSGYTRQTLTKAYLTDFLNSLCTLHKSLQDKDGTDEEYHKNNISTFLKNHTLNTKNFRHITHKLKDYESNIYNRLDLAIYYRSTKSKNPYIIIETKDPSDPKDMMRVNDFKKKSLAQLVHYFYEEEERGNDEVRYLICTNGMEWFIFEAQEFKKATDIFRKIHKGFSSGMFTSSSTDSFYNKVKQADDSFFQELEKIAYYFNLESYINKDIDNKQDQEELVELYKALSPYGILKETHFTDANSLDKNFYEELLYILGLEEKEHSIKESTTENTLIKLISKANSSLKTLDEKLRYILLIINRVLFLKLLEASLITMHPEDKSYNFLNTSTIQDFSKLQELFFNVLAIKDRTNVAPEFKNIPYLNSSLFERQDDENFMYTISNNDLMTTKNGTKSSVLDYLMNFLSCYDFGANDNIIQEESKPLINSAVLGLVFEKINAYKDGSHFTPEVITSYMSDTSIKHALIKLFSRELNKDINTWDKLKEITKEDKSLSDTFNKIKICDPAVGSGHFIVTSLNKLITLKHELGLLCYDDGAKISQQEYSIIVENDELLILDERNKLFKYQIFNGTINKEVQRLQESLFKEKRHLIENCLFGVDINPKSVMICQLRLWIELLKHSFYHVDTKNQPIVLETLPNIDINIKEGNSLISRFSIKKAKGVEEAQPISEKDLQFVSRFKDLVYKYKNEISSDEKQSYRRQMESLKLEIQKPFIESKCTYTKGMIDTNKNLIRSYDTAMFTPTQKNLNAIKRLEKENEKLQLELEPLEKYLGDINFNIESLKRGTIQKASFDEDSFAHSMEWRYEFPEVLDEKGYFVGFDLIIMNPPYFALQSIAKKDNPYQGVYFETYVSSGDIYQLFMERAFDLIHQDGIVSTIISNKWMRAGYGNSTREWLYKNAHTHEVLDLGAGWFESATVDTNIIMYEKRASRPCQSKISAYTLDNKISSIDQGKIDTPQKEILPTLKGDSWTILNKLEATILNKMNSIGKPLKEWDIDINRGISTGCNEAFIIDKTTKDRLIAEDSHSADIIKPMLRGRDIKRYSYEFADKWLLFIPWHFPLHKNENISGNSLEAEQEFKKQYPAVYKHLLQYKDQLSARNKTETGIRYEWYALQRCAATYYEDFDKPKIAWQRVTDKNKFVSSPKGQYILDSMAFFSGFTELQGLYLLGIVNSAIIYYWVKHNVHEYGSTGFRLANQYVEQFPIPEPTPEQEAQITTLVQTILTKKGHASSNQDTSVEENQIDKLVYGLYGLSDEEIDIVEGGK